MRSMLRSLGPFPGSTDAYANERFPRENSPGSVVTECGPNQGLRPMIVGESYPTRTPTTSRSETLDGRHWPKRQRLGT